MRRFFSQFLFGLRFRLLAVVALVCAPLVALMLHTAWQDRRRQMEDWTQRSQEMMQLAVQEEEKVVGQTRQLLLAIAEISQARSGNEQDCQKMLDALFSSYPLYANLAVIKTNGIVLASVLPLGEPANQSDRLFFRRALETGAFAIGGSPAVQTNGNITVDFGCPVFDENGHVQTVVFAALELDWFNQFESRLLVQLPKMATWTEIDRTGKILVRYPEPEKWIGQPFPEKSFLQTAFHQDHGVMEVPHPHGVSDFYAFGTTNSLFASDKVVAILSIPKPVLFAGVNRVLLRNLIGLAIAAGLALALGSIGSSFLVLRPVRTLVNSSARLASGDLSARTGLPHRGDELGQLTRTFDQMAQAVEHRDREHQRAEKALTVSETRYRRLFETAQDGILILNANTGQIDDVNPFLTQMLGYTREQLLGNKLWEIGPFKDIKASQAEFRELQRETYVRYEDLPLETRDGRSISVEFVSNVYQFNGNRVVQCNIRDITKRKKAEAKRNEYGRKLQVLSRRLVEAQETERRHIARELHDEIGQALTVAQLNLQAMLETPDMEALTVRLRESLEVVERVLEQVQDISLNLRPSMLDDLGLEPALRWYTNRQAALTGLRAEVRMDPLERRLDPIIETECFRVTQEALTNVARHAQARAVTVELRIEDGLLNLRVRDDGVGFEVATVRDLAVRGASLGLLSMEERATLAGGGLEFKSAPGQGTEVHAWFPMKWQTA